MGTTAGRREPARSPGWSVRRLLCLLFLAALPPLAFELWAIAELYAAREAEIRQEVQRLLDLVEDEQQRIAQDIENVLVTLAEMGVGRMDPPVCQRTMAALRERYPGYMAVSVSDRQGRIWCSTEPSALGISVADRSYRREALEQPGVVIGQYIVTRTTGRPAIPFALAYPAAGGAPAGVVTILLDVGWLEGYLSGKPYPKDIAVLIADRSGTVLARMPEVAGLPGQPLPDRFQPLLRGTRRGLAEVEGLDGVARLTAYAPLAVGVPGLYLHVALDRAAAMRSVNEAAMRSLLIFAGLLLVTGGVGAWGITRFLRVREEARESRMRAATVLSSTVDGVVEVDRGWRFTYLNDRARDMIGMGQELLGRTVWEAFPELAASELRARVQHAMDAAEPIEVEFRGPRTGRWFWARGFPSSGGLAVYLLDISGRKRAEEELRGSNERLSLALESARAGTFEWDMRTGSGSWSEESYRIFQLDPGRDPATTETWLRVVHPEDAEAVSRAYRTRMLQERVPDYRLEYRIRHPDGSLRWVQSIGRIVYGADGTPLRSSGLNIDITERKAMEEALREAKAKADEANLSKSKFLAAASHDLRQPLQSALLFAGVVQAHVRDEEARGPLASLERALDTLKNLLDSLLDVSRLDAGVIVPQPVDLAVAPLLDEIADAYGPIASAKGLDFHLDRPTPELAVHSDPLLLGRMLRNLVENALRYTDRGGIRVTCAAAGAGLRIGVHDSGIGIPPEHLNRIFEEFHQVGNPERDRKEGLGLGLAIVRRLSGLLGHPVEVRSEPGQGSSFSILVPRAAAPVPPDAAAGGEPETEPAFGVEGGGQGRLALLIDDDVIVLTGLRRLFQEWGFDTAVAGSAEQALECLRTLGRVPDIIVSDYRLRENEVGTAAIARVRERVGRPVPGIILTGEIGPECRDEAAAFGIAVIHKPVTPRQLQGAVRDTLGRAG